MASIQDLHLELREQGVRATAIVTYDLIGSDEDAEEQFRYFEIVELMGVDPRPGEDGVDDSIPNGRHVELVRFPEVNPERRVVIQLRAADLDEDQRPGNPSPLQDEIRARVTLRPVINKAVADSNVVTRGGLPGNVSVAVPA